MHFEQLDFLLPRLFIFHVSVKLSNACFIAYMCVFLRMKQLAGPVRLREIPALRKHKPRSNHTSAMGNRRCGACQACSRV